MFISLRLRVTWVSWVSTWLFVVVVNLILMYAFIVFLIVKRILMLIMYSAASL